MVIATSYGDVYESEFHQVIGEPMGLEPQKDRAPVRITVTPKPKDIPLEELPSADVIHPEMRTFPAAPMQQLMELPNYKQLEQVKPSVGRQDVWNAFKNDLSKLADSVVGAVTLGPKLMEKVYKGEIDPSSEEGIKAVNEVAMTFGLGSIATSPLREGAGMFGGKLGASATAERPNFYSLGKKDIIDAAERDIKNGLSEEAVFEKHGVFFGPDNKPRFEFSDKGARLKTENLTEYGLKNEWGDPLDMPKEMHYKTPYGKIDWEATKLRDAAKFEPGFVTTGPKTVGDILEHPTLYKHYPDVADIPLEAGPMMDFFGNYRGWYDFAKNSLFVKGSSEKHMLSTLLHEVQHAIQTRERHARGGNSEEFIPELQLFKEVNQKAAELLPVLEKRFETEIKPALEEGLVKDWKKAHWSTGIDYGDLKHALEKYHKGDEFTPLQKQLVEAAYDKSQEVVIDTIALVEAQHLKAKLESEAFLQYRRLWGEFESRATQERIGMTPKERKANPFWNGEEFKKTYPDDAIPAEAVKHLTDPDWLKK